MNLYATYKEVERILKEKHPQQKEVKITPIASHDDNAAKVCTSFSKSIINLDLEFELRVLGIQNNVISAEVISTSFLLQKASELIQRFVAELGKGVRIDNNIITVDLNEHLQPKDIISVQNIQFKEDNLVVGFKYNG